ncbi:YoaK family protein [Sphingomonas endophytica]|uniref:DUF1275 domain-containing protein n=1 Tax=Sphingomonas endophytica TaxID=869719 RepID=A0A147I8Q5_9SPHN|nr:DUF1275 family protein [Sphingomonas endophytica]KTT75694.1 hypothetical protein NS334_01990 [Sphingomonas endophytica]
MRYHPSRDWWLAVGLATLAGYVDAIGFLHLSGFFVSFMSGNTTQLAVGVARRSGAATTAGGLVLGFVAGVVLGEVLGRASGTWRRPVVIAASAALLALATVVPMPAPGVAVLAGAMGALNAVFLRDGEVSIGVTYITGTLVKFGQHLAAVLIGDEPFASCVPYLLLWVGLVGGGVIGAGTFAAGPVAALWYAAVAAGGLAMVSIAVRDPR